MSTKLKRLVGMLIAAAVLSVAIFAVFPEAAETQDTNGASMEAEQNTDGNAGAVTASQFAPEEPGTRRIVNSGDSLWAIAQERLDPEATPQQVAEETGRIYELNRERIGDDPNLILPSQELLLVRSPEPATDTSAAAEIATKTAEEPTVAEATPEPKDESAADSSSRAEVVGSSDPVPEYKNRQTPGMLTLLLSLAAFLFTLVVAALAVSKLLRRRRLLGSRYETSHESSVRPDRSSYQGDQDRPRYPEREADEPAADAPEPTAEVSRTSETRQPVPGADGESRS